MTRPILVKAFLEGASIATLAELLGHDVADLEAGLRMGLIEGIESQDQPAAAQPPVEPVALPAPPKAQKAAASSPRPAPQNHAAAMKRDPVRRAIAAMTRSALDLTGYPEALQDPRAGTQRKVYDALKSQAGTTTQLCAALGLDSGAVSPAIHALRAKNLVIGSEDTPVVWRLANG